MKAQLIHIRALIPDPLNPRGDDLGDIEGLAQSIRANGLLEPLIVKPFTAGSYMIIAGHRRYHACRKARVDQIQCMVQAGSLPKEKVRILQAVENIQREKLNPVAEARQFDLLLRNGMTLVQLAAAIGKSTQYVSSHLYLLQLDESTQQRVIEGMIAPTVAIDAVRQVRQERGTSIKHGQVHYEPNHFSTIHPLADQARNRCKNARHTDRRKVTGSGACGECWEHVIRADEAARFTRRAVAHVGAGQL